MNGAESTSDRVFGDPAYARTSVPGVTGPADGAGVRIEQQLGGIEAPPVGRIPRPIGAEAVLLADRTPGDRAVPNAEGVFRQPVLGLFAVLVEETDPDRGGLGGGDGEVRGLGRPDGPALLVTSGPDGKSLVRAGPTPGVRAHRT